MTTREFIKRFNAGEFESPSVHAQIEAGWYDWFCKDKSLLNKTRQMGNIIAKLEDGGKIDLDKTYVWFKNNCPMKGGLYDSFKFADIETREVLMCVDVQNPYGKRYAVYGRFPEGDFWAHPYETFDNLRDLVEWLNAPFGELDDVKKLMKDAKDAIDKANAASGYAISERFEKNDATLILRMRNHSNEYDRVRDNLIKTLCATPGFDVEKQIAENEFGGSIITLTFRKREQQ